MRRDSFRVEGVGCWCPGELTLAQAREMGHTERCTAAREGWEANRRHLAAIRAARQEATEAKRPPPPAVSV